MARLRRLNVAAGALHLAQAVAILWLSSDFALPVTTAYAEFDAAAGRLVPVLETAFEVRIGPLVAGFSLLSAAAHGAVAGPLWGWYAGQVARGMNVARWVEYSLSASLMIVVIAMLSGISDLGALILLFAVNAAMIAFGLVMELWNQDAPGVRWSAFWLGCVAGAVPWVVIGLALAGAGGEGGDVPTFVYWIYVSLFLTFNVFALNMLLQYRRAGRWAESLHAERVYILLSFVAKSALAWQVFAGTLRPV